MREDFIADARARAAYQARRLVPRRYLGLQTGAQATPVSRSVNQRQVHEPNP